MHASNVHSSKAPSTIEVHDTDSSYEGDNACFSLCRHFDVSTTGELKEVKEGIALAFLEQMVSRDQLWITSTVRLLACCIVAGQTNHKATNTCQLLMRHVLDYRHCCRLSCMCYG